MPGVSVRQVTALLAAAWLLASTATVAGAPRYTVAIGEALEHLDVRVCFDGPAPRRLVAGDDRAPGLLRDARLQGGDHTAELKPRGQALLLPPGSGEPACVQYRVDISGIGKRQWRSNGWRSREAVVLDPALWLWVPDKAQDDRHRRIEFVLPPGYDVSAPWRRIGRSGERVLFDVREHMRGRGARMAVGRFHVESIDLPGGQIRYALLPGDPAPDQAAMRRWVTAGVHALLEAYGHLPVAEVQLLVVPVASGREPVPWGEVQRGGGDAVHLYIDQRRPIDEFMRDWVLVHELSHLLHPVIVSRDRWLSEGIASYYQNVLRARAGLRSPQWAWDALHAGFERGIRGTPPGRSLAEVSDTMMRDRSFMRVYWSGAAIALLADVELRRRSAGAQSLDTALARLADCCLPAERSWTARELMQRLDRLTGTTVFMDLYRRYVDSDEFPDLAGVYADLGLQPMSATTLRFDSTAPAAAICEAIMSARKE